LKINNLTSDNDFNIFLTNKKNTIVIWLENATTLKKVEL